MITSKTLYIFLGDCNAMYDDLLFHAGIHRNADGRNQLGRNRRRLLQYHYVHRELSRVQEDKFNYMTLTHDQDFNTEVMALVLKASRALNSSIVFIHMYAGIQDNFIVDIHRKELPEFGIITKFRDEELYQPKNLFNYVMKVRKCEILQSKVETLLSTWIRKEFPNSPFYIFSIQDDDIPEEVQKIIPNLKELSLNRIEIFKKIIKEYQKENSIDPKILSLFKNMDKGRIQLYEELKKEIND